MALRRYPRPAAVGRAAIGVAVFHHVEQLALHFSGHIPDVAARDVVDRRNGQRDPGAVQERLPAEVLTNAAPFADLLVKGDRVGPLVGVFVAQLPPRPVAVIRAADARALSGIAPPGTLLSTDLEN